MKTNNTIKALTLGAIVAMSATSCSDFLTEYSQDLAKVTGWEDLDEVLLGGAYLSPARLYTSNYQTITEGSGNLEILHMMSDEMVESDDDYNARSYNTTYFAFATWQQDTGVDEDLKYIGGDSKYWDNLYSYINITNMVLSLIDEQPENEIDDAANKERVKGEAAFLRAAYYFILVNLYGQPYSSDNAKALGVPLKLSEYVEDVEYTRNTVQEVYDQILADLELAEKCLEGKSRKSIYRADYTTTLLFKSRVYLYMQNWSKAAEYAQKVIDIQPGLLNLATKSAGDDCIYASSPETIFAMGDYLISVVFSDTRYYEPGFYISDDMLALFEDCNDLRSSLYIGTSYTGKRPNVFMKVNGQSNKWGNFNEVSSCFNLRTPEAYLTLAEASTFLNQEDAARTSLRKFLATRLSTSPDVTESGNALIDLIRDERAREFLLEGHRWFDLRRYTVCEPYKWSKQIDHRHVYYDSYHPDYADHYVLEEYDAAYTLPIPREVRSYQISLGNNERPARKASYTESF